MRIGLAVEQLTKLSGTAVHVTSLAKALSAAGHEVHVVHLGGVHEDLAGKDVAYHSAGPLPSHILQGQESATALTDAVLEVTRAHSLDTVHAHYPYAMLAAAVNRAVNGVPYIVTFHGYELQSCLMNVRQLYALRAGLSLASTVVTVSSAQRTELASVLGPRYSDAVVIPDGVDGCDAPDGAAVRRRLGLGDSFVFSYVGRLSVEKGLRELIVAFRAVRDRTDHDVRLLVVGGGQLDAELLAYADAMGPGSVYVVGEVPRSQVAHYLAASDVMVLPSHAESLGTVLLESFCVGTPVVATSVGGIPEVVVDGQNGLLVEARSDAALGEAMLTLSQDPAICAQLTEGAQRSATEYSWETLQERLVALYRKATTTPTNEDAHTVAALTERHDFSVISPWSGSAWQFDGS
ncbi:MAG: glycosyltransferase family 4 protein [Actinocatenispora sp.]